MKELRSRAIKLNEVQMFSADILVLADILTAVYGSLLRVHAQNLTKEFRNHLTLYTLQPIP